MTGNAHLTENRTSAEVDLDDRLHEQVGVGGEGMRFEADLDDLSDGVFVALECDDTTAYLVWRQTARVVTRRLP